MLDSRRQWGTCHDQGSWLTVFFVDVVDLTQARWIAMDTYGIDCRFMLQLQRKMGSAQKCSWLTKNTYFLVLISSSYYITFPFHYAQRIKVEWEAPDICRCDVSSNWYCITPGSQARPSVQSSLMGSPLDTQPEPGYDILPERITARLIYRGRQEKGAWARDAKIQRYRVKLMAGVPGCCGTLQGSEVDGRINQKFFISLLESRFES